MLIHTTRSEELLRRDFLKASALGLSGVGFSGWLNVLANHAQAAATKAIKPKQCIVLWMQGGPSHKDTFDIKTDGIDPGEFTPISTSAKGIQISEHFPKLAMQMHHATVIRSMSTGEGAHGRAQFYMHTGYKEGVGGLSYPALGALASAELGKADFPTPNYVAIGPRANGVGGGFLGAKHQPLLVTDPARGVEDLKPRLGVTDSQYARRMNLLSELEAGFYHQTGSGAGKDHQTTYLRAMKLMQSREAKAFDISQEPSAARSKYGTSKFAEGCLMARRLIEVGVPFVEVGLNGWDTHQDIFTRLKTLSADVDSAMSALVSDLHERGLLDSTLVIWMGDFGRTPKINARGDKPGRDHYPRAWSTVLMGGGVPGGLVVGSTDKDGAVVKERPVSAIDFLSTVCGLLGIDAGKENDTPIGRPIRIVDKKAQPITEILGQRRV